MMRNVKRYAILFMFLAGCTSDDPEIIQPVERKLKEVIIQSEDSSRKLQFQYNEEGHITHAFLDDTIFLELISWESNLITYRYAEPNDPDSSIAEMVTVQVDEANRILNFESTVRSVTYNGNIPEEMMLQHAMFYGLAGYSTSDENKVSEINITNDSILFDFQFWETVIIPVYTEIEHYTSAIWKVTDNTSPVPLPLQDLSALGMWLFTDGSFLPDVAMAPQILLYVLNLGGIGTYMTPRLIGSKNYPEISINFEFQYEFDEEGYVTTMTLNGQENIHVGSFQFVYIE